MPRTEEQFDKIRKARKESIMKKALELFAEEGYHKTSISKIAASAEISKGLIYNYFESKQQLLHQIVLFGLNKIFEDFDQKQDGVLNDQEFAFYIKQVFKSMEENKTFWKMFYSLMLQQDIMLLFKDEMEKMVAHFSEIMFKYFKNKGCDDPMTEMYLFSATIEGAFAIYLAGMEIIPLEKAAEAIIKKYGHRKP